MIGDNRTSVVCVGVGEVRCRRASGACVYVFDKGRERVRRSVEEAMDFRFFPACVKKGE